MVGISNDYSADFSFHFSEFNKFIDDLKLPFQQKDPVDKLQLHSYSLRGQSSA